MSDQEYLNVPVNLVYVTKELAKEARASGGSSSNIGVLSLSMMLSAQALSRGSYKEGLNQLLLGFENITTDDIDEDLSSYQSLWSGLEPLMVYIQSQSDSCFFGVGDSSVSEAFADLYQYLSCKLSDSSTSDVCGIPLSLGSGDELYSVDTLDTDAVSMDLDSLTDDDIEASFALYISDSATAFYESYRYEYSALGFETQAMSFYVDALASLNTTELASSCQNFQYAISNAIKVDTASPAFTELASYIYIGYTSIFDVVNGSDDPTLYIDELSAMFTSLNVYYEQFYLSIQDETQVFPSASDLSEAISTTASAAESDGENSAMLNLVTALDSTQSDSDRIAAFESALITSPSDDLFSYTNKAFLMVVRELESSDLLVTMNTTYNAYLTTTYGLYTSSDTAAITDGVDVTTQLEDALASLEGGLEDSDSGRRILSGLYSDYNNDTEDGDGEVTGTITDAGTSDNILFAEVSAYDSDGNLIAYTYTGVDGIYSLNLVPGSYTITATYSGYTDSSTSDVVVTDSTETSGIDMALTASSSSSGDSGEESSDSSGSGGSGGNGGGGGGDVYLGSLPDPSSYLALIALQFLLSALWWQSQENKAESRWFAIASMLSLSVKGAQNLYSFATTTDAVVKEEVFPQSCIWGVTDTIYDVLGITKEATDSSFDIYAYPIIDVAADAASLASTIAAAADTDDETDTDPLAVNIQGVTNNVITDPAVFEASLDEIAARLMSVAADGGALSEAITNARASAQSLANYTRILATFPSSVIEATQPSDELEATTMSDIVMFTGAVGGASARAAAGYVPGLPLWTSVYHLIDQIQLIVVKAINSRLMRAITPGYQQMLTELESNAQDRYVVINQLYHQELVLADAAADDATDDSDSVAESDGVPEDDQAVDLAPFGIDVNTLFNRAGDFEFSVTHLAYLLMLDQPGEEDNVSRFIPKSKITDIWADLYGALTKYELVQKAFSEAVVNMGDSYDIDALTQLRTYLSELNKVVAKYRRYIDWLLRRRVVDEMNDPTSNETMAPRAVDKAQQISNNLSAATLQLESLLDRAIDFQTVVITPSTVDDTAAAVEMSNRDRLNLSVRDVSFALASLGVSLPILDAEEAGDNLQIIRSMLSEAIDYLGDIMEEAMGEDGSVSDEDQAYINGYIDRIRRLFARIQEALHDIAEQELDVSEEGTRTVTFDDGSTVTVPSSVVNRINSMDADFSATVDRWNVMVAEGYIEGINLDDQVRVSQDRSAIENIYNQYRMNYYAASGLVARDSEAFAPATYIPEEGHWMPAYGNLVDMLNRVEQLFTRFDDLVDEITGDWSTDVTDYISSRMAEISGYIEQLGTMRSNLSNAGVDLDAILAERIEELATSYSSLLQQLQIAQALGSISYIDLPDDITQSEFLYDRTPGYVGDAYAEAFASTRIENVPDHLVGLLDADLLAAQVASQRYQTYYGVSSGGIDPDSVGVSFGEGDYIQTANQFNILYRAASQSAQYLLRVINWLSDKPYSEEGLIYVLSRFNALSNLVNTLQSAFSTIQTQGSPSLIFMNNPDQLVAYTSTLRSYVDAMVASTDTTITAPQPLLPIDHAIAAMAEGTGTETRASLPTGPEGSASTDEVEIDITGIDSADISGLDSNLEAAEGATLIVHQQLSTNQAFALTQFTSAITDAKNAATYLQLIANGFSTTAPSATALSFLQTALGRLEALAVGIDEEMQRITLIASADSSITPDQESTYTGNIAALETIIDTVKGLILDLG